MNKHSLTPIVSPEQFKLGFTRTGIFCLVCGVLTFYIEHVAKTTSYMSGLENFLYGFLTLGSKPIWLKEIRNYAYLWLGLGAVIYFVGARFNVEQAKKDQKIIDEYMAEKQIESTIKK